MPQAVAESPGLGGIPVARNDGLTVGSSGDDPLIDSDALCRMTDRLAASATANIHALLVARRGRLRFERYFTGSDEIYGRRLDKVVFDADTRNDMKSVSKSVASLAVGIAIDRGLIKSVDEPNHRRILSGLQPRNVSVARKYFRGVLRAASQTG